MTEQYPSDATLLALTTDTETHVEYVNTLQSPWYLQFRKFLYRTLVCATRANDLRVYDEGALDIGVCAGKFWDGHTARSYGGSSGNTLADDKANIYVYLSADGTLVIDEYSAWPSEKINHIRLAIVTTSGGDITAIEDCRGQHMWYSPGSLTDEPEFYSDEAGASVEIVAMHWDSASPADADVMTVGLHAENDASEKIEYGRISLTLDDVSDGSEDGTLSFSEIVAGTLTSRGNLVGTTKTQTLTNKTLDEPVMYSDETGASVELVEHYWQSASVAAADEIRIPYYADDDGANKTEYARMTVVIDDETDGTEDASVKFAAMLDGTLTHLLTLSRTGFVPVPLTCLREITSNDIPNAAGNGGVLASDTTPILEYVNGDTDSCLRLDWASSNNDPVAFSIPLPPDLDTSSDLEIHLRIASGGTTDAVGFDVDSFFNEGDSKVEDASGTNQTTSYTEVTATVAAADIPAGAQTISVELTPVAHTTDAMYCTAVWLEYTKV